jgi:hypothetical protein
LPALIDQSSAVLKRMSDSIGLPSSSYHVAVQASAWLQFWTS